MFKEYFLPRYAPLVDNYPKTFENAYEMMLHRFDKKTKKNFKTIISEFFINTRTSSRGIPAKGERIDMATFGLEINKMFHEYYQPLWTIMCKWTWYKTHFVSKFGAKDMRFWTNDAFHDRFSDISMQFFSANQLFGGVFPFMYSTQPNKNVLYNALYYYILELYDCFDNIKTIEQLNNTKFKYPFKYITPEHMLFVAEMHERYDLLDIAEKNKMNFVEFADYVINYVECIKSDINISSKTALKGFARTAVDGYNVYLDKDAWCPRIVYKQKTMLTGHSSMHRLDDIKKRMPLEYVPKFEYELYER